MYKSQRRVAREDIDTNIPLEYEPDAGEDNAPFLLPDDNTRDRPFPNLDPFHYNNNLIESKRESRVDRLARRLLEGS